MRRRLVALFCAVAALESQAAVERWYSPQHAAVGAELFARHCAACHGANAEGAAGWQHPGADGHMPAPPLNGSAHAWHHPLGDLVRTILQGQGNMPGWRGVLSVAEILAVVAWFQSLWSDEIYAAWQRMDAAAGTPGRG
jgi:mono/diheme cytochrome c family protein